MNEPVKFIEIKAEIRILGPDDGSFTPQKTRTATLVGLSSEGESGSMEQ